MNAQFEDLIEQLYWEFDDLRSKKTKSERDIFKELLRKNSRTLAAINTTEHTRRPATMKRLPSIIDAVEFRRDQYMLTQSDWAKVIGIQKSHYSEFVNGKRNLTLAQAAQCFAFGVPAEALFQCRNEKHIKHIANILGGQKP